MVQSGMQFSSDFLRFVSEASAMDAKLAGQVAQAGVYVPFAQ